MAVVCNIIKSFLLVLYLIDLSYSYTFNCQSDNQCMDDTITCLPNEDCLIKCTAINSCKNILINGPTDHPLTIECDAQSSCYNATIKASDSSSLIINGCYADQSCLDLTIFCPPKSSNNAKKCFLEGNGNLGSSTSGGSADSGIQIYAINGWTDIQIIYNGSYNYGKYNHDGTMYCTSTYSIECPLSFFAWKCSNDDAFCNNPSIISTTQIADDDDGNNILDMINLTTGILLLILAFCVIGACAVWYKIFVSNKRKSSKEKMAKHHQNASPLTPKQQQKETEIVTHPANNIKNLSTDIANDINISYNPPIAVNDLHSVPTDSSNMQLQMNNFHQLHPNANQLQIDKQRNNSVGSVYSVQSNISHLSQQDHQQQHQQQNRKYSLTVSSLNVPHHHGGPSPVFAHPQMNINQISLMEEPLSPNDDDIQSELPDSPICDLQSDDDDQVRYQSDEEEDMYDPGHGGSDYTKTPIGMSPTHTQGTNASHFPPRHRHPAKALTSTPDSEIYEPADKTPIGQSGYTDGMNNIHPNGPPPPPPPEMQAKMSMDIATDVAYV